MNPLISVVMPVLNGLQAGRDFLRQAVWSVARQDYEGPIEFIIVDDGSTDGTKEAIQKWADEIHKGWNSRRIVLSSRPHEGVTHSLNHGIRLANGKYVARHDADDWSMPDRFTRQVQYMEENPEVGMVGSAIRVIHNRTDRDEVWYRWNGERIPKTAFAKETPFCHGSVMIRRDVLTEVGGYDTQFPHAQDYDLFWRIAKQYPVASISDPLYAYRVHGGRVTANRRKFQTQLRCARQIKSRINRELIET